MAQKFQGFGRHWFRSGNRANPNFRVIWMPLWAVNDLRGKEQWNLVQFALAYDDAVGEYLSAITQHGYISDLVHETAVLIVDYRLIDTIANSFTAFTDGDLLWLFSNMLSIQLYLLLASVFIHSLLHVSICFEDGMVD